MSKLSIKKISLLLWFVALGCALFQSSCDNRSISVICELDRSSHGGDQYRRLRAVLLNEGEEVFVSPFSGDNRMILNLKPLRVNFKEIVLIDKGPRRVFGITDVNGKVWVLALRDEDGSDVLYSVSRSKGDFPNGEILVSLKIG